MKKLEKLEQDIKYYNDQIYNTNNSIDALNKRIKEIQKTIDKVDIVMVVVVAISFLLYVVGHVVNPIISIVGLLSIPSLIALNVSTNKIEKEMKTAEEKIIEYKTDILFYNQTLDNLTHQKEVQDIINNTLDNHSYNNNIFINKIDRINEKNRNR